LKVALPLKVTELGNDRAGGNDDDTFVLLHGYAGSSFTWRGWEPHLALRGRVLLVDMKGFGEAPKPDDGRYSPLDFAELVTELMEERDLRRVTLVGHSLGGGVALLSALREVDLDVRRIVRLVLVAAPGYRQRLPPFVGLSHRPRLSTLLLRALGPRRIIRGAIRSIVYDRSAVSEEQIDAYTRPLLTKDGMRALLDAGRQIVPEGMNELSKRFGEISVPVLLLWGRQDRVVPLSIGQRLAHDLPHAQIEILERCGHIPPEELPEQSWQIVESFLEGNPVL
jgi:pimeloyl-ACP methyl ester carboxylesterase